MFCDSSSGKCKDTEKIWGIIGKNTNRLHRLTFSRGLAKFIAENYNGYEFRQLSFKIGRKLNSGEKSKSGLYALMSKKGDYTLRISLNKEIAELYNENDSRYLAEAWLTSK